MTTHRPAADVGASGYNYEHFGLEHRTMDRLDRPEVGQAAPDFTAQRLADGTTVELSDYRGRTVVLETGSATCPMYASRIAPMNALAEKFSDTAFLLLYTREAHPGENIGPHRSMADKIRGARLLAEEDGERRTVLIDDLAGTAHRAYGAMPDMLYVIDGEGTVVFRAQWNDPTLVEQALTALANGEEVLASPPPGFPATLPADRVTRGVAGAHLEPRGQAGHRRHGTRPPPPSTASAPSHPPPQTDPAGGPLSGA
ncbi:deiodinase-like protein [Pseudonocardia nigra]|uniref:deiodinase-like protein n=1 Tax=Pseudonocardia nigra TaxID=1921578 RepID=UPI001C5F5BD5|nr:deiodinase-like protein [Pseudonocardia nigra]